MYWKEGGGMSKKEKNKKSKNDKELNSQPEGENESMNIKNTKKLSKKDYEKELGKLQVELVKLQE